MNQPCAPLWRKECSSQLFSIAGPASKPVLGKVLSTAEPATRMDSGQPLRSDHQDLSLELLLQIDFAFLLPKLLKKYYTTNVQPPFISLGRKEKSK